MDPSKESPTLEILRTLRSSDTGAVPALDISPGKVLPFSLTLPLPLGPEGSEHGPCDLWDL